MSYNDLVNGGKGKGPSEEGRLNILLKSYETENLRLKTDLSNAILSQKECLIELDKSNRIQITLNKEINSLKNNLKIERKVGEGLLKKSAILDFDANNHKEDNSKLVGINQRNERRIKELEQSLYDERIKRLQNIHELEILRRKNIEIEALHGQATKDKLHAETSMLKKIQRVETVMAENDILKKTIDTQAAEIIQFTQEIFESKEYQRSQNELTLSLESRVTDLTKDKDAMQEEVWRLRKELLHLAVTPGEKNAFYTSRGQSRGGTAGSAMTRSSSYHMGSTTNNGIDNATTARPSTTSSRVSNLNRSLNSQSLPHMAPPTPISSSSIHRASSLDYRKEDDLVLHVMNVGTNNYEEYSKNFPVISPQASAYRPYTSTANTFAFDNAGSNSHSTSMVTFDDTRLHHPQMSASMNGMIDAGAGVSVKKPSTAGADTRKSADKLSNGGKSMFLGSGLGLRRQPPTVTSSGGAKQVLAKIMADFNNNN